MTTEELEKKTVEQLQELASALEIDNRSKMKKDELVEAVAKAAQMEAVLSAPNRTVPAGLSEWADSITRRLSALEDKVAALDDRTGPSTRILGSRN